MRAVSPSAIEKWTTCPRRYAFNYLQERWESGTKAAEAGTRVHALLEAAKGHPVESNVIWEGYDISRLATALSVEAAFQFVGEPLGYEVKFEKELEGVPFKGVIDRLYPHVVVDFKTTGSDLKWAKTPTKLKKDVQRLVYSAAYPETTHALWLTGSWRSYEVQPALLEVNHKKDKANFKLKVLKPAEEILALTPGTDPLSLPPPEGKLKNGRYEACTKFNVQCPFQDECFPRSKMSTSLLEKVLAEQNKEAAAQQAEAQQFWGKFNEAVESAPALAQGVNDIAEGRTHKLAVELVGTLYIDCMPMKGTTELEFASNYISEACEIVKADIGVHHPMLIDFGKGPGHIAAQLIANLEERKEPIPALFLETKSAEGRGCMQALIARSAQVVKGVY